MRGRKDLLAEAPPSLGVGSDRRRWLVRDAGLQLGAVAHGALSIVFGGLGFLGLAAWSVAATVLFAGLTVAHRRGAHVAVAWVAGFEANLHVGVLSWVLGPDAGAWLMLFPLALAPFALHAHRSPWQALAWSAVPIGVFVFVGAYGTDAGVSPAVLRGLYAMNAAFAFIGTVGLGAWLQASADRVEADLDAERDQQRSLINTLMPARVASRWLAGERRIADALPDATVLFADVVGFTGWSAGQEPSEVLLTLERLFARFDALAEVHGIEKIKTIGDGYMAATFDREGTERALQFAVALQSAVHDVRSRTGMPFDLRIGVHSGPVVAGLLGQRRFQYDVFGDVVNVASRLESQGVLGAVQVSDAVRARVAGRIPRRGEGATPLGLCLSPQGELELRGRGRVTVYLVEHVSAQVGSERAETPRMKQPDPAAGA